MNEKPTGVFVRLPLDEAARELLVDASAFGKPDDSHAQAILSIGTPVTGSSLIPIGEVARHFSDGQPMLRILNHPNLPYQTEISLYSEAQAAIAALGAEVVRLREENERLNRKTRPQFFCSDILEESSMDTREGIVAEARDCDDDLQAFTIFEMEGYAKVHKSYGFYDQSNKCHWFDTEAEALSAVAGLKGGAA
ncbi:hypothetical protein NKW53_11910 [Acetobacter orientalis]|uniref:hypothetical protein n=1 Tax=Acetobacter orientalis TaxID=146474 RepID=UPI0020A1C426|nr:hypothetical protein [Acetobacter orientalis]MCP1216770.1 hypothetical protein [Acetobacter orientalis]MCP1219497.1 hypothetical protein [Acetobacter orientalis]